MMIVALSNSNDETHLATHQPHHQRQRSSAPIKIALITLQSKPLLRVLKMSTATTILYKLSPALSKIIPLSTTITRPAALKGIWDYIKENNLKHPTETKVIKCDANLAAVMNNKTEVTFTEIMKFMSPHLLK